MWGNKFGWQLAGVLMAVMVIIFVSIGNLMSPSGPSVKFEQERDLNLAVLELPVSPSTVVPMNEGDGTPLYQDAIKLVVADRQKYEDYCDPKKHGDYSDEPPEAVAKIIQAAHSSTAKPLDFAWQRIANYQFTTDAPELEAVVILGSNGRGSGAPSEMAVAPVLVRYAAVFRPKNPDGTVKALEGKNLEETVKVYEALFAFGAKLYEERLSYRELEAGLGMMGAGSKALQHVLTGKDDKRVEAIGKFAMAMQEYQKKRIKFLHEFTASIDGKVNGENAGNVFELLERSKERMWRVEAAMQLGRTKLNMAENGRGADQTYAMKLAALKAERDRDPVVRNAAAAARDLNKDTYQQMQ